MARWRVFEGGGFCLPRRDRWRAALPNPPPPLGLEAPLVEQVPEEWWNADRAVWGGLDFSWMTAIRSFDHWDVERHSPWRDVGTPFWPNGFPLFFDLTPWAKLRLAKGLAQGHPAEAVAEVEHLASLLLSTETVLGASIGLQYLGFVDQALGALEADGKRPPASANRIDGPTRARLWRAIMAAQDFLRPQTPPDLREVEPAIVAGRCAALNEALHAALATLALDRPEDAPGARWLEALLQAETVCRMTWVREAWRDPAHRDPRLLESVCDSEGIGAWACRTVKALPFTRAMERRLAAEVLLQIALANYLKHPAYP